MTRLFFILPIFVASIATAAEIPEILDYPNALEQYKIGEIKFSVTGEFSNPFDPQEIEVWADINTDDGIEFTIPAFYTRDFEITPEDDREVFTATSEPYFCVRMTCEKIGTYTIKLCAKDAEGKDCAEPFEIECTQSSIPGFIRVHPENQRYFADSRGNTFVPIGIDVGWGEMGGSLDYEKYFSRLAQNGGNFSRVWQTHFNAGYTIEWGAYHWSGIYCGLGCYSLEAAARLDRIFQIAQSLGIHILWVINQHSQFECAMWSSWDDNPFNAKNGGPCESSVDFFTSQEANRLYGARIRYLIARYSAFTSLFAWELFNEIELISGTNADLLNSWQREKAELIKNLDPYKHMITTSYAIPIYLPAVQDWTFDGYDLIQKHIYFPNAPLIIELESNRLWPLTKPMHIGEIGLDFKGELEEKDVLGIAYHNSIWCALATGYAGTPASWWWDSWVDQYDWYRHLKPVSNLVKIFDFAQLDKKMDNPAVHAISTKLEAFGMKGDKVTFIWIHDTRSQWRGDQSQNFDEVLDAVLIPYDLCGKYTAAIFNTWSGEVLKTLKIAGCPLTLKLPAFSRDVAVVFEKDCELKPYHYEGQKEEEKPEHGCGCSF